ncbi:unnamed protein product [Closterium sp. NIES-54]
MAARQPTALHRTALHRTAQHCAHRWLSFLSLAKDCGRASRRCCTSQPCPPHSTASHRIKPHCTPGHSQEFELLELGERLRQRLHTVNVTQLAATTPCSDGSGEERSGAERRGVERSGEERRGVEERRSRGGAEKKERRLNKRKGWKGRRREA